MCHSSVADPAFGCAVVLQHALARQTDTEYFRRDDAAEEKPKKKKKKARKSFKTMLPITETE